MASPSSTVDIGQLLRLDLAEYVGEDPFAALVPVARALEQATQDFRSGDADAVVSRIGPLFMTHTKAFVGFLFLFLEVAY